MPEELIVDEEAPEIRKGSLSTAYVWHLIPIKLFFVIDRLWDELKRFVCFFFIGNVTD